MSTGLNDVETIRNDATNGFRVTLGVAGVISLLTGILIVAWPGATGAAVTAIIAVYMVIAGIVYGVSAFVSKNRSGLWRFGHILLALLFLGGGVTAFANLGATSAVLAIVVGISVGVVWVIQGVVALTTLDFVRSRGFTIFFAVISILAGITMFFSPIYGVAVLWILVGVSAILLGVIQIVRAFQVGRN